MKYSDTHAYTHTHSHANMEHTDHNIDIFEVFLKLCSILKNEFLMIMTMIITMVYMCVLILVSRFIWVRMLFGIRRVFAPVVVTNNANTGIGATDVNMTYEYIKDYIILR
jgi:capsular polysaccharide biosynthesis protein